MGNKATYDQSLGNLAMPKETTLLDLCRERANDNDRDLDVIQMRISSLLQQLRGPVPQNGCDQMAEKVPPMGALNEHLSALEYQARRIGEIAADLTELERLL